jgi:DNA-binding NtrC family response regulator
MTRVLVIEDEQVFAALLKRCLEREGLSIDLTHTLKQGWQQIETGNYEVVLTDLYLEDGTALEFLARLRERDPLLPTIIMTAKHTTETAIQAVKQGAYDYFAKPDAFDFEERSPLSWRWVTELRDMIETAAESRRLTPAAKVRLPDDTALLEGKPVGDRMIGESRPMQDVFKAIGRAAASDVTVLIRGGTGTGKELAARALYSHSARASRPLIVVNSAAIPENLLESELFGHEKGAFTHAHARRIGRFEQADGGTIFLDEIGDMSFPLQQKLLRVLQEKTIERVGGKETIHVDVRVIAATHRNLELAVQESEFRQDLYFRLNVASITLPPLSERREDIPILADYFLRKYRAELGSAASTLTPEALQLLQDPNQPWPDTVRHLQSWPGNVRQLRNVIRKALLLARGLAIGPEIIKQALEQMVPPRPTADETFGEYVSQLLARSSSEELDNARETALDTALRELYSQAIHRAAGDQTKAARWLGVSRPTMLEKLRRFGLHPGERT